MYVTGRWVSQNVVGTMFVAWLIGVAVFLCLLFWQLRKQRGRNNGMPRAPARARKCRAARRRRRKGR